MTTEKIELPEHDRIRKNAKYVSFYSRAETPEKFLRVEHTSLKAAQKGSWQSPAMKAVFIYRGYREL
jgi:hypothetical protein